MSRRPGMNLNDYIRNIPDFPKPGIQFKDITPLLLNPEAFQESIDRLADHYAGQQIDLVVAAEARGFLFAAPLAIQLNAGLVPIRKPGKLPYETFQYTYELEYGSDTLEMHTDAVRPGQRVLVLDDLLATGGTVTACCRMVEKLQANIVGCAFAIELTALGGRAKLAPYSVYSLLEL
jgi:adenine phosphoribosyltransferase